LSRIALIVMMRILIIIKSCNGKVGTPDQSGHNGRGAGGQLRTNKGAGTST